MTPFSSSWVMTGRRMYRTMTESPGMAETTRLTPILLSRKSFLTASTTAPSRASGSISSRSSGEISAEQSAVNWGPLVDWRTCAHLTLLAPMSRPANFVELKRPITLRLQVGGGRGGRPPSVPTLLVAGERVLVHVGIAAVDKDPARHAVVPPPGARCRRVHRCRRAVLHLPAERRTRPAGRAPDRLAVRHR